VEGASFFDKFGGVDAAASRKRYWIHASNLLDRTDSFAVKRSGYVGRHTGQTN
jgi:hypothetical protein